MSDRSGLRIVALGGLGEIGMNCLLLECEKRILIIDCGVMFPEQGYGIDVVTPKFDYILDRAQDIEGIWITHGHEDHIGAVPHLLDHVNLPVYAPAYALGLLREKLAEKPLIHPPIWHEVRGWETCNIGPFKMTPIPVAHTIIDTFGFLAETPAGTLMHSTDFKLDLEDAAEKSSPTLDNYARAVPDNGIDLLFADSTGIEEKGVTGREQRVTRKLDEIIADCKERVFVALFSSNVDRVDAVARLAIKHGRKFALAGRSVQMHTQVASNLGRLDLPVERMVSIEEASTLPRDRVLIIISGTQGEHRSSLTRVSQGMHNLLRIDGGDTVIFSSRFIPGNEVAISGVIDGLIRQGATVVHQLNQPEVHVSGHACHEEQKRLIDAVRPKCFIPVHGTLRHLVAHSRLADGMGIESVEVIENGMVAELNDGSLVTHAERIPVGRVNVDGVGGLGELVLRERRRLADRGILIAVITINPKNGRLKSDPDIIMQGVIQEDAAEGFIKEATYRLRRELESAPAHMLKGADSVSNLARRVLKRYVTKTLDRHPVIIPHVIS